MIRRKFDIEVVGIRAIRCGDLYAVVPCLADVKGIGRCSIVPHPRYGSTGPTRIHCCQGFHLVQAEHYRVFFPCDRIGGVVTQLNLVARGAPRKLPFQREHSGLSCGVGRCARKVIPCKRQVGVQAGKIKADRLVWAGGLVGTEADLGEGDANDLNAFRRRASAGGFFQYQCICPRDARGEGFACAAIIPDACDSRGPWTAVQFYGVAIAGDGVKRKVGCGQLGDIDFHFEGEFILANVLVGDRVHLAFRDGSGYDVAFRRRQPESGRPNWIQGVIRQGEFYRLVRADRGVRRHNVLNLRPLRIAYPVFIVVPSRGRCESPFGNVTAQNVLNVNHF